MGRTLSLPNQLNAAGVPRWHREEAGYAKEIKRIETLKARNKGKTNVESVSYNTITLQYKDDFGGQKLKFEDDSVRYRAALRAKFLYSKGHRQDYDVITGQEIQVESIVTLPEKPVPPRRADSVGVL